MAVATMSREAFGPNLRRIRIQRGVSIEHIARAMKVPSELLDDLERNDFSRWPSGVYARAYVRQYAAAIGVDPHATVDEFCRWFPQGDRRAERIVREHADIVGHDLDWRDDLPPNAGDSDRRGAGSSTISSAQVPGPSARAGLFIRLRKAFGKA
jgi:transcriptional regulator with XRE-family HTH domain